MGEILGSIVVVFFCLMLIGLFAMVFNIDSYTTPTKEELKSLRNLTTLMLRSNREMLELGVNSELENLVLKHTVVIRKIRRATRLPSVKGSYIAGLVKESGDMIKVRRTLIRKGIK
jgi:hypothetical protein